MLQVWALCPSPIPAVWGSAGNAVLVTRVQCRNDQLRPGRGWVAWTPGSSRGCPLSVGSPGTGGCMVAAALLTLPAGPSQQERLKAQEHRADVEEKVSKRSLEAAGKAGLTATGPGLLPRKPPGLATAPTGAYSKAGSPPPSPRASPVAALKAKVIQKLEDVSKPPAYAYPATPSSQPSSPPPASPPPAPGITRKEEAPENVVEKKDLELEKEAPSPFQTLFSGRGRPAPFCVGRAWGQLSGHWASGQSCSLPCSPQSQPQGSWLVAGRLRSRPGVALSCRQGCGSLSMQLVPIPLARSWQRPLRASCAACWL